MKKKTSLWISGITTVAMLAVAVGSFAAWDTLKPETNPSFAAKSGTPIELKVETSNKIDNSFDNKTLVPEGAVLDGSKDIEKLSAGVVATFTGDASKGAKVYMKSPTVNKGTIVAGLTTTVMDKGAEGTDAGTAVTFDKTVDTIGNVAEITPGHVYEVSVKFTDGKDGAFVEGDKDQTISASVECFASKSVVAP
ncbi:hypothetical protein [Eubacterium callanderi]|uniref:SipW-cognate class signal peptide n=1 Tax=Eubacterium callanderi TaxID=53442 RepID=A0A853JR34_9FIRM|nr:hypothetical protein [Eubacterium callanderi]